MKTIQIGVDETDRTKVWAPEKLVRVTGAQFNINAAQPGTGELFCSCQLSTDGSEASQIGLGPAGGVLAYLTAERYGNGELSKALWVPMGVVVPADGQLKLSVDLAAGTTCFASAVIYYEEIS